MKVVSDTSPICYLLLIGEINLLPALFGSVLIPEAVAAELADPGATTKIRRWVAEPPSWIEIRRLQDATPSLANDLTRLHRGEREAIQLAQEISADLLLLDEREARRVAENRDLAITGLVGLLDRAANKGLVDLQVAVARLRKTNFRVHPKLLAALLRGRA